MVVVSALVGFFLGCVVGIVCTIIYFAWRADQS